MTAQNAPVLAFLWSLVPEQSALLPVFIFMGVTDDTALNGLARMQTRDDFMYQWVQRNYITALQFTAIMTGLRAMHTIPPLSSQVSV